MAHPCRLQSMHVGQQILDVLRAQHLAVARHIRTAVADDVGHAFVIRRQSSFRKILMLENAFQAWALLALGGVGAVTAVAVVVVNLAPGGLLGVEAEFGIGLAALHLASRKYEEAEQS